MAVGQKLRLKERSVLPGFGLAMGYTMLYLSALVLIPLTLLFFKSASGGWEAFKADAFGQRTLDAYRVTFGCSLLAASINAVFGFLVAWVLVRYRFPGRNVVDALVDLPFALPTAVGGIALATAYGPNGLLGAPLGRWGEKAAATPAGEWFMTTAAARLLDTYLGFNLADLRIAYTPLGITLALIFISLPFVVRTVQPVLQELDVQLEEAASSLGAGRWVTFRRVIMPSVVPAAITGFTLAFARAIGEYGSVVFISSNKAGETEIAPLLIMSKLDAHDVAGATSVAVVMLVVSFVLLLSINGLQWWSSRRSTA